MLLQNQINQQNQDVTRMKQEMVAKDIEARDRIYNQKLLQDKIDEYESQLRAVKGQLKTNNSGGKSILAQSQVFDRTTLKNTPRMLQSSFS